MENMASAQKELADEQKEKDDAQKLNFLLAVLSKKRHICRKIKGLNMNTFVKCYVLNFSTFSQ